MCRGCYGQVLSAGGAQVWAMRGSPGERFAPRVDTAGPIPAGAEHLGRCWLWTGAVTDHGYGVLRVEGQVMYAHRWAWVQQNGPVPDGLVLDHLCHVAGECAGGDGCAHRRCVRVSHLAAVTTRENVLRGSSPLADRLRRGHLSVVR
jgi:hypothetical protein